MQPSMPNLAPTTIETFVGAKQIKDRVRVALEAVWNSGNGCVFPHSLMLGPPGLGKTELSRIIAREMGCELVETLGQSVRTLIELNAMLLMAEGAVLLIDEAHSLNNDMQVALLKALQEGTIFLQSGSSGKIVPMTLRPFCLIAATDSEWALARPLVDRFRLILRFEYYDHNDLTTLISRRARSANLTLSDGVAEEIAKRSKGTPRLAIRLLDSCNRTMLSEGASSISLDTFVRTCQLEQIDSVGLDVYEQKYLRLLSDAGGCQRVNVIASCLGLHRITLERAIEPYLIRASFVEKTDAGRILTVAGREHLMKSGVYQDAATNQPQQTAEGEPPCQ